MSEIKVEIGQYREVNKTYLKAFFTLVIHPIGLKIIDCKYFIKNDQRWFTFPDKEYKKPDGKTDYFPIVSCLNKDYNQALKDAVLNAISQHINQGPNAKVNSNSKQTHPLHIEPSSHSGELPF